LFHCEEDDGTIWANICRCCKLGPTFVKESVSLELTYKLGPTFVGVAMKQPCHQALSARWKKKTTKKCFNHVMVRFERQRNETIKSSSIHSFHCFYTCEVTVGTDPTPKDAAVRQGAQRATDRRGGCRCGGCRIK
jgi:hypothetical protein